MSHLSYYQRGGMDGAAGRERRELPEKASDQQRADYELGYLAMIKFFQSKQKEVA